MTALLRDAERHGVAGDHARRLLGLGASGEAEAPDPGPLTEREIEVLMLLTGELSGHQVFTVGIGGAIFGDGELTVALRRTRGPDTRRRRGRQDRHSRRTGPRLGAAARTPVRCPSHPRIHARRPRPAHRRSTRVTAHPRFGDERVGRSRATASSRLDRRSPAMTSESRWSQQRPPTGGPGLAHTAGRRVRPSAAGGLPQPVHRSPWVQRTPVVFPGFAGRTPRPGTARSRRPRSSPSSRTRCAPRTSGVRRPSAAPQEFSTTTSPVVDYGSRHELSSAAAHRCRPGPFGDGGSPRLGADATFAS